MLRIRGKYGTISREIIFLKRDLPSQNQPRASLLTTNLYCVCVC